MSSLLENDFAWNQKGRQVGERYAMPSKTVARVDVGNHRAAQVMKVVCSRRDETHRTNEGWSPIGSSLAVRIGCYVDNKGAEECLQVILHIHQRRKGTE